MPSINSARYAQQIIQTESHESPSFLRKVHRLDPPRRTTVRKSLHRPIVLGSALKSSRKKSPDFVSYKYGDLPILWSSTLEALKIVKLGGYGYRSRKWAIIECINK